jgi:cell division cycle 2-like protein
MYQDRHVKQHDNIQFSQPPTTMGKRDRWDSSSEEEDNSKRPPTSSQKDPPKTKAAAAAATSSLQLSRHNPLLQGCRSVYDTYERLDRVSEGAYGVVWKARCLATTEIVALKQIKFDAVSTTSTGSGQGFPVTALREINVLLALQHESIVSVKEMVVGDGVDKVFMVMEFFEFDLKDGIQRFDGALAQAELKGIMQQILQGMDHMHSKWFLHRDMKTSNILVHGTGRIALADFGLARRYQEPAKAMTQLVVTLWYRAPELLFGEACYGPAVDMWSIGCIFGELITKDAIMPGQGELDQIDQIFSLVGVPNDKNWPDFDKLPNAGLFRWKPRKESELLLPFKFPVASPVSTNQAFLDGHGYDLLKRLLTLDPAARITAAQALEHAYFSEGVVPQTPRFFSATEL